MLVGSLAGRNGPRRTANSRLVRQRVIVAEVVRNRWSGRRFNLHHAATTWAGKNLTNRFGLSDLEACLARQTFDGERFHVQLFLILNEVTTSDLASERRPDRSKREDSCDTRRFASLFDHEIQSQTISSV